jgi:LysR family glycine cleavage system transcriptional activator
LIRADNPGRSVHVTALETPPNLARNLFDLSIFLEPDGAVAPNTRLWPDEIIAVCAPDLKEASDWTALPRLVDESWSRDWDL